MKHKAHREARSLGRNWEAVTCLVAEGTSMRTCYVTPAYSGLDEMNARGKASTCSASLPTPPRRSTKRANLNTKAIGKHSVSSYPRLSGAPGPSWLGRQRDARKLSLTTTFADARHSAPVRTSPTRSTRPHMDDSESTPASHDLLASAASPAPTFSTLPHELRSNIVQLAHLQDIQSRVRGVKSPTDKLFGKHSSNLWRGRSLAALSQTCRTLNALASKFMFHVSTNTI